MHIFIKTVFHNTPRDSPTPLRCLPHMGAHREAIRPRGYRHATGRQLWPARSTAHRISIYVLLYVLPLLLCTCSTGAGTKRQLTPAFLVILCTASTLAFHMSIRFLTSSPWSPLGLLGTLPQYSRPNSVSTALLVSSSTKLFPILMVIWEYDVPAAARSLGWAVVANNVEALKILLDCGYGVAALLATAGALSRWLVGRAVLWAAGLDGVDSQGEGSVAEEGKALWALIMYVQDWVSQLAI